MIEKEAAKAALSSWTRLNAAIKELNERDCYILLNEELCGRKRPRFLFRIHSRINRVRAARERRELQEKINTWR